MADNKEDGGGHHIHGRGFCPVVHGRGEEGGAVRLCQRERMYGDQAGGLCPLGEHSEEADARFKACGVQNVYMPIFIPESLLQKEKDHVEGFAPEVAWVTHGGMEPLQERMCVRLRRRPCSVIFTRRYSLLPDLPRVYNQWCSVVRWEKTTRPFLRSREFLWQEGHTAHATAGEAQKGPSRCSMYTRISARRSGDSVIRGQKTDKEKFAGAEATYTIEALMHDGKALQSGTSHNFGDGFAKAFEIQYTTRTTHKICAPDLQ